MHLHHIPTVLRLLLWVGLLSVSATVTAREFLLPPPGEAVVGELQHVATRQEETLLDVARRYHVGFRELRIANPNVDPWLPGERTQVILPTRYVLPDAPRQGIVVNIPEMRLYYYPKPRKGEPARVITYPISVGRRNWHTPLGLTRIVRKIRNPSWRPPKSIREEHAARGDPLPPVVPPGPDNPLGRYALRLGLPGYLIHGTNKPDGIGMQVTHGCIRLFPEDIEDLFRRVPVNLPVRLVDQPFKGGWRNGELYLEAHPPLDKKDGPLDLTEAVRVVSRALQGHPDVEVDWSLVRRLAANPSGIPVVVSRTGDELIEANRSRGPAARDPGLF
ncbi:MAG TPA: hypothetical protein ENK62_01600 [Chromatiales bacterium]|nr:hypothetical protein [Chromatiales bacterium]